MSFFTRPSKGIQLELNERPGNSANTCHCGGSDPSIGHALQGAPPYVNAPFSYAVMPTRSTEEIPPDLP